MPTEVSEKIFDLVKKRYASPGVFQEFTQELMDLGVVRQSFDVLTNSWLSILNIAYC